MSLMMTFGYFADANDITFDLFDSLNISCNEAAGALATLYRQRKLSRFRLAQGQAWKYARNIYVQHRRDAK